MPMPWHCTQAGMTPFMYACDSGNIELVEYFIRVIGSDPHKTNDVRFMRVLLVSWSFSRAPNPDTPRWCTVAGR